MSRNNSSSQNNGQPKKSPPPTAPKPQRRHPSHQSASSSSSQPQTRRSSSSSSLGISQDSLQARRQSLASISETPHRRAIETQDYNKPELLTLSINLLQRVATGHALTKVFHYQDQPIGLEKAFDIVKKSLEYVTQYNNQTHQEKPAITSDQIARIQRIVNSQISDQELQGYFSQQDFREYLETAETKIRNLELRAAGIDLAVDLSSSSVVDDERSSSSSSRQTRPYGRASSSNRVFRSQQQEQNSDDLPPPPPQPIEVDDVFQEVDDLPPPPPELLEVPNRVDDTPLPPPPLEVDPEYQKLITELLALMYAKEDAVKELEHGTLSFKNDIYRCDENNNGLTLIKIEDDGSEKTLETKEITGLIQDLEKTVPTHAKTQTISARTSSSSVRKQHIRRRSSAIHREQQQWPQQQQHEGESESRRRNIREEDKANNPFFDQNFQQEATQRTPQPKPQSQHASYSSLNPNPPTRRK